MANALPSHLYPKTQEERVSKRDNFFDVIVVDVLMVIFGLALVIAAIAYAIINGHLAVVFACFSFGCAGMLALLMGGSDLYYRLRNRR